MNFNKDGLIQESKAHFDNKEFNRQPNFRTDKK